MYPVHFTTLPLFCVTIRESCNNFKTPSICPYASVVAPSILTASTDDAVHGTGSLFDSAEKSEYRIPPPREKFLHELRRNRDKQRAISAAIHFRATERQTSRKYFSMSTRASRKVIFATIELNPLRGDSISTFRNII